MKKLTALLFLFFSIIVNAQFSEIIKTETWDQATTKILIYNGIHSSGDTAFIVRGWTAPHLITMVSNGKVIGEISSPGMASPCAGITQQPTHDIVAFKGKVYMGGYLVPGGGVSCYDFSDKKWSNPIDWTSGTKDYGCGMLVSKMVVFKDELFVHYFSGSIAHDTGAIVKHSEGIVVWNGNTHRLIEDDSVNYKFLQAYNINDSILLLQGEWFDSAIMKKREVWGEWDGVSLSMKDTLPEGESLGRASYNKGKVYYHLVKQDASKNVSIIETSELGIRDISKGLENYQLADFDRYYDIIYLKDDKMMLGGSFYAKGTQKKYYLYWNGGSWIKFPYYYFNPFSDITSSGIVKCNNSIYAYNQLHTPGASGTSMEIVYITEDVTTWIRGFTYIDENKNCKWEESEPRVPTNTISINNNDVKVVTNDADNSFISGTNNKGLNVITSTNPYQSNLCNNVYSFMGSEYTEFNNMLFALEPNIVDVSSNIMYDVKNQINLIKFMRMNRDNTISLNVENKGTKGLSNVELILTFDTVLKYVSTNHIGQYNVTSGKIVVTIDTLPPVSNYYMYVKFFVTPQVALSWTQHEGLFQTAVSVAGDVNNSNNNDKVKIIYRAPYDPNDKMVNNDTFISSKHKELIYQINFQNEGNDTAEYITIKDEMQGKVESIEVLDASADYTYSFNPETKILEVYFGNINLPFKSVDEQGSMGYLKYKVKLRDNLEQGDEILNTAKIYFEFQPAIVTNTTVNIVDDSKVNAKSVLFNKAVISIYPNPAGNQITINNLGNEQQQVELTDMTGKVLKLFTLVPGETVIKTDDLASGLFFVKTPNGVHKLIISH